MRDGAAVIMEAEFERQKNEGQKYFPEPLTLKFFCPESFCHDCWEGSPCRSSCSILPDFIIFRVN